ncbi:MAG: zinc ribbon domain-containing protein [Desulfobacterales bacterium]|jgi:putative FmdB family regulatory protein
MPLYDYVCENCGGISELLMNISSDQPQCSFCGSPKLKKLVSAHSSLSGAPHTRLPGAGDTGCCGSQPHQADCQGPGSCCGKAR